MTTGPSCPACDSQLSRALRASAIEVPVDGAGVWAGPLVALYCGGCGHALGFVPAGLLGANLAGAAGTAGPAESAGTAGTVVSMDSGVERAPAGTGREREPEEAFDRHTPSARRGHPTHGAGPSRAAAPLQPGDRVFLEDGRLAGRDAVVREVDPDQGLVTVDVAAFGMVRRFQVDPRAVRRR